LNSIDLKNNVQEYQLELSFRSTNQGEILSLKKKESELRSSNILTVLNSFRSTQHASELEEEKRAEFVLVCEHREQYVQRSLHMQSQIEASQNKPTVEDK